MKLLSVNVNKIATLRNSRGHNLPNLCAVIKDIISYGARGITIHPRPDQRHIKRQDVFDIKNILQAPELSKLKIEFNIEGFPSPDFLQLIEVIRPHQCTLVPDPPDALTSNAGWNFKGNEKLLSQVCQRLRDWRVRSSLFMDPFTFDQNESEALRRISPDRVELYTEKYAKSFNTSDENKILNTYKSSAQICHEMQLGVNAGHDLNQENLPLLLRTIPEIQEVSIGHALICEALYAGLKPTVQSYLRIVGQNEEQ